LKQVIPLFIFSLLLFFHGCSEDASVNIFDKKLSSEKIKCMRLVVFPPNEKIEKTINELYSFKKTCPIKLELSYKSGIVCNSNQNSQKKALSNFPTSYLKIQISKDRQLFYSYYIDLKESLNSEDIKEAFIRIKKDLIL